MFRHPFAEISARARIHGFEKSAPAATVGEVRSHENSRNGSAHEAVENHAKAFESQHELSLYQIGGLPVAHFCPVVSESPDA
jgi:hypothetical protein